jgi:hypothetical protein
METVFGRVFEVGLTPLPGPDVSLIAELGYGPLGSDPRFDAGWVFTGTSFNVQDGGTDEYAATIAVPDVSTTTSLATLTASASTVAPASLTATSTEPVPDPIWRSTPTTSAC